MLNHITWTKTKLCILLGSILCTVGTAWTYSKTLQSEAGRTLRDLTPLTFELARLETITAAIEPQLAKNREAAAQLDTEIAFMKREIERRSQEADVSKQQMAQLRADLASDKTNFVFEDRSFTKKEVEHELARRLNRYVQDQAALETLRQTVSQNEGLLAQASDQIHEYEHQRDMLVDKHNALSGELTAVEAAGKHGDFRFDNSLLTEAQHLATEVEKRIRTLHKLASYRRLDGCEIPVPQDSRVILAKYDERFATPHAKPANQ